MGKNKNIDDEDFEIEYLGDELDDNDGSIDEQPDMLELEEIGDETDYDLEDIHSDSDRYDDEYEDYDDEQPYDDSDAEIDDDMIVGKLTKNQIVNRVMAGMGVVIAGFTIFFGIVIYGVFHTEPKTQQPIEQESADPVIQEPTTEPVDTNAFVSPYTDENVSDDVKELLNGVQLKSMNTGLYRLDNRVDNVIAKTVDESKSNYDNVRNIYDYLVYNFELTNKSYVDDDTVYDTCSSVDYTAYFDMELIYRANKALSNNAGSSEDFACALTVLYRSLGLEAYYIDGEKLSEESHEYESHGYVIVDIDDEYYVFDTALEKEKLGNSEVPEVSTDSLISDSTEDNTINSTAGNTEDSQTVNQTQNSSRLAYEGFCKELEDVSDRYGDEGIEESIEAFNRFETLGELSFNVTMSSNYGGSATGSVRYVKGYSEDGNVVTATGEIEIDMEDAVYIKGSVSGSSYNTWKLIAKVYDDDMNYITESVIYNESTGSSTNQVTYYPSRAGNIKLVYMVTDENGRTCTVSKMITVVGEEEPVTTKGEPETEETTTEEELSEEEPSEEEPTEEEQEPPDEGNPKPPEEQPSGDVSQPEEQPSPGETTSPQEGGTTEKIQE